MKNWLKSEKTICIRRTDIKKVHDYARRYCSRRDYLFIRLPMKIGLRTSEITTLKIENISFEHRGFYVLDVKKKHLYPLPLDIVTLQLIHDLIDGRRHGYVFSDRKSWKKREGKPLNRDTIWRQTHMIGLQAGVQHFSSRLLRHFFSATWIYDQKKSMETLRRILRHDSLFITHRYLARLCFWEDIQQEFEEVKTPFMIDSEAKPKAMLGQFYENHCAHCLREPTCSIMDQVCASPWATGCKYYMPTQPQRGLKPPASRVENIP